MTQNNLGNALKALGERESGTARLEEAVAAYDAALTIFIPAGASHYIKICEDKKAAVEKLLAEKKRAQ